MKTKLIMAGAAVAFTALAGCSAPVTDGAELVPTVATQAAQVAWESNTTAQQTLICDGWNMGAEALMRDSYIEGAGGDDQAAELWAATVIILDREC